MMITACGYLSCDDNERMSTRENNDEAFEFKYSEFVDDHDGNSGSADDHSNIRQDSRNAFGMSLEKA